MNKINYYQADSEQQSHTQLNENNNLNEVLELSGFFEFIKNPNRERPQALPAPDGCCEIEDDNSIYISGLGTCYPMSEVERVHRENTYNQATINGYQAIGIVHNGYKNRKKAPKKPSLNLALIYNKKAREEAIGMAR